MDSQMDEFRRICNIRPVPRAWRHDQTPPCEYERISEQVYGMAECPLCKILDAEAVDDSTLRLFAVWCARQMWGDIQTNQSRSAVVAAEAYARGNGTADEMNAAAKAAVGPAYYATWDASYSATWAGVWTCDPNPEVAALSACGQLLRNANHCGWGSRNYQVAAIIWHAVRWWSALTAPGGPNTPPPGPDWSKQPSRWFGWETYAGCPLKHTTPWK